MTARAVDAVFAGLLALLGIYIVANAVEYGYMRDATPGPGFFPLWVGLALVGLSVANILRAVRGIERLTTEFDGPALRKTAAIIVIVALFVLTSPWIGMIPASGLLVPALALVIRRHWTARSVAVLLALAVVFPIACYFLFAVYLRVPMVTGVFGI
jgi:putative tricarboxylic transport membrane protein